MTTSNPPQTPNALYHKVVANPATHGFANLCETLSSCLRQLDRPDITPKDKEWWITLLRAAYDCYMSDESPWI